VQGGYGSFDFADGSLAIHLLRQDEGLCMFNLRPALRARLSHRDSLSLLDLHSGDAVASISSTCSDSLRIRERLA